jgi:hypothetical protein
MVSDDEVPPIEVKAKLGRNEDLMAAIRFNPEGTKLYAVNWNCGVVVDFPRAQRAEVRPEFYRSPTLVSAPTFPLALASQRSASLAPQQTTQQQQQQQQQQSALLPQLVRVQTNDFGEELLSKLNHYKFSE